LIPQRFCFGLFLQKAATLVRLRAHEKTRRDGRAMTHSLTLPNL
jgi:hypothetical protein